MTTRASRAIRSMVHRDAWAIVGEANAADKVMRNVRQIVRKSRVASVKRQENGRANEAMKLIRETPASGAEHGRRT